MTKGEGVGWKTALNCEVRLEKLKMEVVPSNHEVDAGEIFDQTEVLHSLLPYTLSPQMLLYRLSLGLSIPNTYRPICRPKEVTYRVFFFTGAP